MPVVNTTRIEGTHCNHCGGVTRGYATVDGRKVCHPHIGLDCYRLVTIYRHPTPCSPCKDVRVTLDYQEGLRSSVKDWPNSNELSITQYQK